MEKKVDTTPVDVCLIKTNPRKIFYSRYFFSLCLSLKNFLYASFLQNTKPKNLGKLSCTTPCIKLQSIWLYLQQKIINDPPFITQQAPLLIAPIHHLVQYYPYLQCLHSTLHQQNKNNGGTRGSLCTISFNNGCGPSRKLPPHSFASISASWVIWKQQQHFYM